MNRVLAIAMLVVKELYRRKDFYVLFVITAVITLLLGAVNFFNEDRVVRYLKEVCLLLIWVSALVVGVTTAARQIPAERESRTIFPLLAKPVTRLELLLGKFLGCWLACGIALVLFYVFFGVLSGSREHHWPVLGYLQALWLHWCFLGVVTAMAMLGSVVFTAPSSNATIVFLVVAGIMLLGGHLNRLALRSEGLAGTALSVVYFAIPHLELFDVRDLVIHNWPLVSWWACLGATAYAMVYSLLFLMAGWLVFRRQPLT
jgi:ABC-type transport system involved in multi-copper enzyme maturation permease subunit